MPKRVYQTKPQPLAVQIQVQRAIVVQNETALEDARTTARIAQERGLDMWGKRMTPDQIAQAVGLVSVREQQLAETVAKLAALQAQED